MTSDQGDDPLQPSRPDILLLAAEWQPRALLRAQLIEEGLEVFATDNWATMQRWMRPGTKPSFAIIDLQGLLEPERVLSDLAVLMRPSCVLVLTSIGTVKPHTIEALGFHVARRPIRIGSVVATVTRALGRRDSPKLSSDS